MQFDQIKNISLGDSITIKDFRDAEYDETGDLIATVTAMTRWDSSSLTAHGIMLEFGEDNTIMIFARIINGSKTFWLMREIISSEPLSELKMPRLLSKKAEFIPFKFSPSPDIDDVRYEPIPSETFKDVRRDDGELVSLGTWSVKDFDDDSEEFWASCALAELQMENGNEGYVTFWIGSNIDPEDIKVESN